MSKNPRRQASNAPSAPASSATPRASVPQPNLLLKRACLQRGWSQQEVADQVGGPRAFMVNRWENGVIFPGPGYRKKLCALFERSAQALGLVRSMETGHFQPRRHCIRDQRAYHFPEPIPDVE